MNYVNKSRTSKLINKIRLLKSKCSNRNLYDALLPISRITNLLQDNVGSINKAKYKQISNCLNNIDKNLDSTHLFEIKYECEKINNIIFGKNQNLSIEEEKIMKNNKKIIQLQDIISDIDKQIVSNNNEMEKCLGVDQISWHKYNASNKILKQKRLLYLKQYKNSIILSQNMEIINDAKMIKTNYSDVIANELANMNVNEFITNMDYIDDIDLNIKDQNEIIGDRYQKSIDDEIDEEYRAALEDKLSSDTTPLNATNMVKV